MPVSSWVPAADNFYRIKELYSTGGEALREISRRKPIPKNRVAPEVEEAVVKMAFDYPAYGQARACNELRKQGIFLSAAVVCCVWQRHVLEFFGKRLKALEAHIKTAKFNLIRPVFHFKQGRLFETSKQGRKEKSSGQTALSHQKKIGECSEIRHSEGRRGNYGSDGLCDHCRKRLAGEKIRRWPHRTALSHRKSKLQRIACPRLSLKRACAFVYLPAQTVLVKAPSFTTSETSK